MVVTAVTLALLSGVYFAMGPFQLGWDLATRRTVLPPYIVVEGLLCPILEPIFLPQMLDVVAVPNEPPDEHLTNCVTSVFQFAFNLGQVVGPFLGAYFIERHGFRGALIRWGAAFLAVAVLLIVRVLRGRAARGPSTGYKPLAAEDGDEDVEGGCGPTRE